MTFKDAVKICIFQKFATFSGRASRSEYWWFFLAYILASFSFAILFLVLKGISGGFGKESGISTLGGLILLLGGLAMLVAILPSIAVTVRRFHDYNLSGWWVLAGLVLGMLPVLGWIATVVMMIIAALKGTAGNNRFGRDPAAAPDPLTIP
jgi:uncharacterized membrane protein YhaH (DUF805 family)